MRDRVEVAVQLGGETFMFTVDPTLPKGTVAIPTFATIDALQAALGGDSYNALDDQRLAVAQEDIAHLLHENRELRQQLAELRLAAPPDIATAPVLPGGAPPAPNGEALQPRAKTKFVALGKTGVTTEQVAVALSQQGGKLNTMQRTVLEMRYGLGQYDHPADLVAIGQQFGYQHGWAGNMVREALRVIGITPRSYTKPEPAPIITPHAAPTKGRRKWS
jgi:hypothetical protein